MTPDTAELFERQQQRERQWWKQRITNPMSLRFTVCDPDRWLTHWYRVLRPFFSGTSLVTWTVLVILALVLTGMHWNALVAHASDYALSPRNLVITALLYPLLKLVHELGHAVATKFWGGEVHEVGISFLVFMPVPYVDASAAWAFPERYRRILVSAAGIMVEMGAAALAMLVWVNVEAGLVKDMAFSIMLIGGMSTVLFNGNPLLKFDGYYVLSDLIDVPNLATRSNRYLAYLVQRYAFGIEGARSPLTARGERGWFVFYGIAAYLYRLFIMVVIALYVATEFFFIGVCLAIYSLGMQLVLPMVRAFNFVLTSPALHTQRGRAVTLTSATTFSLLAAVLFLPMPTSTVAQGVVWLPEQSQVRPGTDGVVAELLVEPGQRVAKGQMLLRLHDPFLEAERDILVAQYREVVMRHKAALKNDRVEAQQSLEEIEAARAAIERMDERIESLNLRSESDGRFVLARAQDLEGRFVKQGEPIGFIVSKADLTARVVVPQDRVGLVRDRTHQAELRVAGRMGEIIEATIQRQVPEASERLPSRALATVGGGPYVTDPEDPQGTKTVDKVFELELGLPPDVGSKALGSRVYARFDHGREPLAHQWYRGLRQLFLNRFDV